MLLCHEFDAIAHRRHVDVNSAIDMSPEDSSRPRMPTQRPRHHCLWNPEYRKAWRHTCTQLGQDRGSLSSCTHLSNMSLDVQVDPMGSWPGLITAMGETLSQVSSPVLSTLCIRTMGRLDGSRSAEFWTVELEALRFMASWNDRRSSRLDSPV